MVILAPLRVVEQFQTVLRVGHFAALVVPDEDFGVALEIVPEPLGIEAVLVGAALGAHAAVAGLLAEQGLPAAVALGAVGVEHMRYLVNHVTAVEAQRHAADHALAVEIAHPADDQVFAGGGLVVGLLIVGQARGHRAAGPELSVDKDIEPLGQLVDDHAILVVGRDGFEQAGLDIAADDAVVVIQPLNQRPSVLVLAQHMHGGGRAVDEAAQLVIVDLLAAGGHAGIDLLALPGVQHGDGPLQQLPAGFLVGDIVGEVLPEPRFARLKSLQPFFHGLGRGTGQAAQHKGTQKHERGASFQHSQHRGSFLLFNRFI